jgi:hypothetical protein
MVLSHRLSKGNGSHAQEKTVGYGQQTIREAMHRLQERPAKDPFRHDAHSWIDLVHLLDTRTPVPASGDPLIVMVQPSHDRKSDHFVPCILSARNRSALFRDLLCNALMGSCPVEVGHIGIEHALELLLAVDHQVVQAFLSDAPHEAFAGRISSGCMDRRFEYLNRTRARHMSKARPIFVIVISNQIFRCLSIRRSFSQLLCRPGIGRRACHAHMDHLARLQFDDEEGKERSKEQIGDL